MEKPTRNFAKHFSKQGTVDTVLLSMALVFIREPSLTQLQQRAMFYTGPHVRLITAD